MLRKYFPMFFLEFSPSIEQVKCISKILPTPLMLYQQNTKRAKNTPMKILIGFLQFLVENFS